MPFSGSTNITSECHVGRVIFDCHYRHGEMLVRQSLFLEPIDIFLAVSVHTICGIQDQKVISFIRFLVNLLSHCSVGVYLGRSS